MTKTMSKVDLFYMPISEASAGIEAGSVSPLELTRALLERIEATDSQINSYVLVLKESALALRKRSVMRFRATRKSQPVTCSIGISRRLASTSS